MDAAPKQAPAQQPDPGCMDPHPHKGWSGNPTMRSPATEDNPAGVLDCGLPDVQQDLVKAGAAFQRDPEPAETSQLVMTDPPRGRHGNFQPPDGGQASQGPEAKQHSPASCTGDQAGSKPAVAISIATAFTASHSAQEHHTGALTGLQNLPLGQAESLAHGSPDWQRPPLSDLRNLNASLASGAATRKAKLTLRSNSPQPAEAVQHHGPSHARPQELPAVPNPAGSAHDATAQQASAVVLRSPALPGSSFQPHAGRHAPGKNSTKASSAQMPVLDQALPQAPDTAAAEVEMQPTASSSHVSPGGYSLTCSLGKSEAEEPGRLRRITATASIMELQQGSVQKKRTLSSLRQGTKARHSSKLVQPRPAKRLHKLGQVKQKVPASIPSPAKAAASASESSGQASGVLHSFTGGGTVALGA